MLPEEYSAYLSKPIGKADCLTLAKRVMQHPAEAMVLLQLASEGRPGIAWRAGWVIATLGEEGFIGPKGYVDSILQIATTTPHPTVVRGILRGLEPYQAFSETEEGTLVDVCFQWLDTPGTHVSTLSICVRHVVKLCQKYPELWAELKLRLSRFEGEHTAAYRAICTNANEVYRKHIAPNM